MLEVSNYLRGESYNRCKETSKASKKVIISATNGFVFNFKYEKPSIFCFLCGHLEHSEGHCEKRFDGVNPIALKRWGAWLRPAPGSGNFAHNQWFRDENGTLLESGLNARGRVFLVGMRSLKFMLLMLTWIE